MQNCDHQRSLAKTAPICRYSDLRPQKNRDAVTRVPVWELIGDYRCLRSDMGVIREMQVVLAITIKIDPALHCGALRRTDGYRQRRRTVGRYRYAARDRDRGIARAEGSSIPNTRDRSAERVRRKLCRRDCERFVSTSWVA